MYYMCTHTHTRTLASHAAFPWSCNYSVVCCGPPHPDSSRSLQPLCNDIWASYMSIWVAEQQITKHTPLTLSHVHTHAHSHKCMHMHAHTHTVCCLKLGCTPRTSWSLTLPSPISGILYPTYSIGDLENNSKLRKGIPVAHSILGVAQTINSANYVYFLALEKTIVLVTL